MEYNGNVSQSSSITGGKQYIVGQNEELTVEHLEGEVNDSVAQNTSYF